MQFMIFCFFSPCKQRIAGGNVLDKLVSGYQAVYGSQLDEDAIFNKCRNAINFVEKVDKDTEGNCRLCTYLVFVMHLCHIICSSLSGYLRINYAAVFVLWLDAMIISTEATLAIMFTTFVSGNIKPQIFDVGKD